MRILLACLLLAGAVPAKTWEIRSDVVDDWRIDGQTLRATLRDGKELALPIRAADLAVDLGIKEDAVPAYLNGLDCKLPLLVEHTGEPRLVGLGPLTEERLRKELRLELTPALEVKLVNAGRAVHRVVKPGDGSESGWREPEICFEREVDGKWVRGAKLDRCKMFAQDWQKDIVDLKPGDSLPLNDWWVSPSAAFGDAKATKVKLRAVYAYRGGLVRWQKDPEPGPMGKTPSFALVSEPVEVEIP